MTMIRFAFCLLLPLLQASCVAATAPASGRVRCVPEGVTYRLTSGERIRIADIDAAETHDNQAKCAAEIRRAMSAAAKARPFSTTRMLHFPCVAQL